MQKVRRKYLKVNVLRRRKRNANPKEEEINVAVENHRIKEKVNTPPNINVKNSYT